MANTREKRHGKTRELILKTARDIVIEKGFHKLSLREVARRVDYSPAGIYEYFKNKEELMLALGKRVEINLGLALRKVEGAPSLEKIVKLGVAYINFAMKNPQDYLLLFSGIQSGRRSFDQTLPPESPYQIVADTIQSCLDQKLLRFGPGMTVEAAAFGLWSLVHGQSMLRLTHLRGFNADFDSAANLLVKTYIQGLG